MRFKVSLSCVRMYTNKESLGHVYTDTGELIKMVVTVEADHLDMAIAMAVSTAGTVVLPSEHYKPAEFHCTLVEII
jgi:hypothetical protein